MSNRPHIIEPSPVTLLVVEQVDHDLVVIFGDREGGLPALPVVCALGQAGSVILSRAISMEDLGLEAISSPLAQRVAGVGGLPPASTPRDSQSDGQEVVPMRSACGTHRHQQV